MGLARVLVYAVSLVLAGCMTYKGFPEGYDKPLPRSSPSKKVLYFAIEGSAMFAGPNAIRVVIAGEAPYEAVSAAEKPPATGDYLSVKIGQLPPTMPALVFGYLSYATATILPFWSTSDGSTLLFTLYRDGATVTTREYVIQRKTFIWILMLPLIWLNATTPSEEETFAASTRDFFATLDGKPPAALRE